MIGNIHWPNTNSSYSHGIVCHNCVVRKYSEVESAVRIVYIGTLVEIYNVQKENLLFCIVKDDMQVDNDLFICKKGDILFVPENLWGPLLTVEEKTRLSIVEDHELAEALGNIGVGNTVKVLVPDFKDICIAKVTFKNSIAKLGVGVYFGLKITYPQEDLQLLINKLSLLQPATKGFPRGCDIVVSVDKIRPVNACKNSYWLRRDSFSAKGYADVDNNYSSDFKLKVLKDNGISVRSSQQDCASSHSDIQNITNEKEKHCDLPLLLGDEVVYFNDGKPEKGTVKWLGYIRNLFKVGIEFENPIGSETGLVDGVELFNAKFLHAALMPPETLIKLTDFEMNNSNDYNNQHKAVNNNDYNNLRSNIHSNWRQSLEDKSKMLKINSFQNPKYLDVTGQSGDNFQVKSSKESHTEGESGCSSICNAEFTVCNLHMHYPSKTFDSVKSNEKKIGNNRQSKSMDIDLTPNKDILVNLQNSLFSMQKSSCKNLDDFFNQSWTENCELHGSSQKKDFYLGLADYNLSTRTDHCDCPCPLKKKNIQDNVLEHNRTSASDRYGSDYLKQHNENFYDVPTSALTIDRNINKTASDGKYVRNGTSNFDVRKSCKNNFSHNRRPSTLSHYNNGFYLASKDSDIWEPQNSEASSSDESGEYYDAPKPFPDQGIQKLGIGSVVELLCKGQPHYGVIRWVGYIPEDGKINPPRLIAGVEMEEERNCFTDGTFLNKRYFHCNPKKALFLPLSKCRKDSRFTENNKHSNFLKTNTFGQLDCPVIEGTIPPISQKGDLEAMCGKNRGIQGHHNSCYLDATLFAMFAFTSVFDSLLYRPPSVTDIPQYSEVQRVLKEEIVNPLRKNLYVRADRVMKLRTLLENLSSVSGLTCDEKDPEEFLNSLLAQILRAEPFLKLSSGQETFHYQLFVEKDERLTFPSVQQLFEQSFITSDIKLKQVPSCLIIQMPRFGKSYKMYSRIFPPQLLDVTDIIENSPRQCTVCGKLAEYECKDCFGQNGIGNGLESISFCKTCLDTAHNHHCRSKHNYRSITVPFEFFDLQEHCTIPRIYMELFAVVCIETSHYVAFVKCGAGSDAPWCFFDSMADRKGEQNGYNIPEMVACPDLPYWLSEEGAKTLNEMKDERQLPEYAKRLLCDAYMCMYQSPDIMMYR